MSLSSEEIQALLHKTPQTNTASPDMFYKHNFDKAALFLLDLGFANLFEPIHSESNWFRCKGCTARVKRTGRESHHTWHKRDLTPAS